FDLEGGASRWRSRVEGIGSMANAVAWEAPDCTSRILLLEDDPDVLESMAQILRDAGYSVEACRNGRDALSALGERPADLIVLDLMMPVMDGWEFRAAQRADRAISHIPVVVITGDESAKAAAIHADSSLKKPLTAQE